MARPLLEHLLFKSTSYHAPTILFSIFIIASVVITACIPRKGKYSKDVNDNAIIRLTTPTGERKLPSVLSSKFKAAVGKALSCKNDGEEAVWKKTILMGDKCRPLEFSGQINYDSEGKQLLKNSLAEEVDWVLGVRSSVRKNSYGIV